MLEYALPDLNVHLLSVWKCLRLFLR